MCSTDIAQISIRRWASTQWLRLVRTRTIITVSGDKTGLLFQNAMWWISCLMSHTINCCSEWHQSNMSHQKSQGDLNRELWDAVKGNDEDTVGHLLNQKVNPNYMRDYDGVVSDCQPSNCDSYWRCNDAFLVILSHTGPQDSIDGSVYWRLPGNSGASPQEQSGRE